MPSYPISLTYDILLFCLGLPICLFPVGFLTKLLRAFLVSPCILNTKQYILILVYNNDFNLNQAYRSPDQRVHYNNHRL
jgi:hypothetical protein